MTMTIWQKRTRIRTMKTESNLCVTASTCSFYLVVIECGQYLVLAISHFFTSSFQVMDVEDGEREKETGRGHILNISYIAQF